MNTTPLISSQAAVEMAESPVSPAGDVELLPVPTAIHRPGTAEEEEEKEGNNHAHLNSPVQVPRPGLPAMSDEERTRVLDALAKIRDLKLQNVVDGTVPLEDRARTRLHCTDEEIVYAPPQPNSPKVPFIHSFIHLLLLPFHRRNKQLGESVVLLNNIGKRE